MSRIIRYLIVATFVLNFFCSNTGDKSVKGNSNFQTPEILELEYVLSFGSELTGTLEDYFIVGPYNVVVNGNGDIIMPETNVARRALLSANEIRAYNEYGIGKAIFSRRGQGPGEFESMIPVAYPSPDGYIIIKDTESQLGNSYNLFDTQYKLIRKSRYLSDPLLMGYISDLNVDTATRMIRIKEAFAINATEMVYGISIEDEEDFKYHIVYQNDKTLKPLLVVKDPIEVKFQELQGYASSRSGLGKILWCLVPDRKICYLNPDEDIYNPDGNSYYVVHFISIDSGEDNSLHRPFTANKIDKKKLLSRPANSEIQKRMRKYIASRRICWPSTDLVIYFREYIYFYLYDNEDTNKYAYVDIFNAVEGIYINSIDVKEQPLGLPGNRCVYLTDTDEDGFPIISRYDIDPVLFKPEGKLYKIVKKVK